MTDPDHHCEYVLCRCGREDELKGPDGVYEFCTHHAKRMVEYSPNFEWPNSRANTGTTQQ